MEQGFVAIPLEAIPLGISLPFALFVKVGARRVKFRSPGDQLTRERIQSLQKKVDTLFIPQDDWRMFLEKMEELCPIDASDPVEATQNVRRLLLVYSQHLEQEIVLQRLTVNRIRVLAYRLADLIVQHPKVSEQLLVKCQDASVYFCTHNVNVAVYSVHMGLKMGMNLEWLQSLAFSCLMHNVGNMLIPRKILYAEGPLSHHEETIIKKHAKGGAELLAYADCPSEVILTARQHHERIDGRGYPLGLRGEEIHLFARICAIADAYDALTSCRPKGATPLSPQAALQEMRKSEGQFDPSILARL